MTRRRWRGASPHETQAAIRRASRPSPGKTVVCSWSFSLTLTLSTLPFISAGVPHCDGEGRCLVKHLPLAADRIQSVPSAACVRAPA